MPERIELICGQAAWVHRAQIVVAFVAATLILSASSPLAWRLAAIAALAAGLLVDHLRFNRHGEPDVLLVRLDGTVIHRSGQGETIGLLIDSGWVSRWVCVVRWRALEATAGRHSLVCASRNSADDYRRLRVWLRLGVSPEHGARSW